MKKFLTILAAAAMICGCSDNRTQILKVYNWGDYIDESAISEFENWYKEQTGESVKVIYQTFDINETMLSKIEKGHEDYDVVCPSDYIIERMLKSDLLLPIDRNFGTTTNYTDSIAPFVKQCFDKIDGGGKDANDYSVTYMWGTTGILYNTKYVTDEEASSWDILRNPKFADKIFVKDSPRDVYSQIIFLLKQKELKDSTVTKDQLMQYTTDADIDSVESYMKQVKKLVAGWEADFGKEEMTQERGWINLTWSGDAEWAIEEAAKVGVNLKYQCPKEGYTVWFDGWVIPKYAKNVKAARYWVDFMCRPDIAARNVDVTGYVSALGSKLLMENSTDDSYAPIDLTYFFGPGTDSVHVNPVLYPDKATIERSAMEHDWGENTSKLISMWSRVKGENANSWTIIIIGACVVAIAVFAFRKKIFKTHGGHRRPAKSSRK